MRTVSSANREQAEGGMRRAVRAVTNQEQRALLKPSDRDRKCVQHTESVGTVAEQFFVPLFI
jgi:hypothetical protein